jgi:hypothetical protein
MCCWRNSDHWHLPKWSVYSPLHQHIFCSNTTNIIIFFRKFSTIKDSGSKTTLLFHWWRLFVTLNLSSALSLLLSLVFVVVVVVANNICYFVFHPDFVLKYGWPNTVFCVLLRYCSTLNFMPCLELIVTRIANTYCFKLHISTGKKTQFCSTRINCQAQNKS